ncbi:hypothetical protein HMPREF0765_0515 [Sphingobacterium spiritivorum ATCC 33300]|uniref:Uncharacterized protein n=1 Tax=Sphingobacterium spiritivorum ATCC 33300 TaxID=525372 RepID=C2FT59_SPHSI|nr:hypothetical protein HMPREF0765_0515 [Sphingobacterium spiritivorum ATCC 33300]
MKEALIYQGLFCVLKVGCSANLFNNVYFAQSNAKKNKFFYVDYECVRYVLKVQSFAF